MGVESDLISIHSPKFVEIISGSPKLNSAITFYAREFVSHLNKFPEESYLALEVDTSTLIDHAHLMHVLESRWTGNRPSTWDEWQGERETNWSLSSLDGGASLGSSLG